MSTNKPLAKRYAKAFLHDDLDREAFETMIEEVQTLVDCIVADESIHEFFVSPVYSRDKKIAVVRNLVEKLELTGYTTSLLEILIRKYRIELLKSISEELKNISDTMNNRIRIKLTTANEPSLDDIAKMSEQIKCFFGREILVERRIDTSIIGGFVIEGDGKLIDMSFIGQIRRALTEI